ncbi:MAG TPA: hypothetical protein DF383_02295 [Deltaproteobacteria bacterium]|nr:hypothetical protein [Deltaproteobacteria bacterium]
MLYKKPRIIAVILTELALGFVVIFSLFMLSLSLGGMNPNDSSMAMVIWAVGQLGALLAAGIFAAWATKFFIARWNWSRSMASLGAVMAGVLLGVVFSALSVVLTVLWMG